jgi:hypothetical protein
MSELRTYQGASTNYDLFCEADLRALLLVGETYLTSPYVSRLSGLIC